jgi:hypothetical protein
MNASKTRHLDTAIQILGGNDFAKRHKLPVMQVTVHHDPKRNEYIVQVGHRVVSEAAGSRADAIKAGEEQVQRLKALGKKACLITY